MIDSNQIIIDVREPEEFSAERVPGSINAPLSSWQVCAPLLATSLGQSPVNFICKSGTRAKMAAQAWSQLPQVKSSQVKVLDGGITELKKQGIKLEGSGVSSTWSLFRQVQAIVGPVVFASSLAALFINPLWAAASAFFGLGLTIAGCTGFCGLAMLLAHMPWNKRRSTLKKDCCTTGACHEN